MGHSEKNRTHKTVWNWGHRLGLKEFSLQASGVQLFSVGLGRYEVSGYLLELT